MGLEWHDKAQEFIEEIIELAHGEKSIPDDVRNLIFERSSKLDGLEWSHMEEQLLFKKSVNLLRLARFYGDQHMRLPDEVQLEIKNVLRQWEA